MRRLFRRQLFLAYDAGERIVTPRKFVISFVRICTSGIAYDVTFEKIILLVVSVSDCHLLVSRGWQFPENCNGIAPCCGYSPWIIGQRVVLFSERRADCVPAVLTLTRVFESLSPGSCVLSLVVSRTTNPGGFSPWHTYAVAVSDAYTFAIHEYLKFLQTRFICTNTG